MNFERLFSTNIAQHHRFAHSLHRFIWKVTVRMVYVYVYVNYSLNFMEYCTLMKRLLWLCSCLCCRDGSTPSTSRTTKSLSTTSNTPSWSLRWYVGDTFYERVSKYVVDLYSTSASICTKYHILIKYQMDTQVNGTKDTETQAAVV